MKPPIADKSSPFIETPNGTFTAAGNWFHTTEEALMSYAEPVLAHRPFAQLLKDAEAWLRIPLTIVLWSTPLLLWRLGVTFTLVSCIVLYCVFSIWTPALVTQTLTPLLKVFDNVLMQALLYVVAMSWFAINGYFILLAVGLLVFVLTRWGIVSRLLGTIVQKMRSRLYKVPYPDQVLNSVIIRTAMKYHVSLPELERMERSILNRIHGK